MDEERISQTLSENGYELLHILGCGACATVYKALHIACQNIYSIKVIKLDMNNQLRVQAYKNEVAAHSRILHPNIITVYNYFQDDTYFYIVLEYCPNGSIRDRVLSCGPYKGPEFMQLVRQILDAIKYLHENNISHGDIKPENILFDEQDRPKLGDFGLANIKNDPTDLKTNFQCSPVFAAPEQLMRKPYDPMKADMWSFGVSCIFIATTHLIFNAPSITDILNQQKKFCILDDRNFNLANISLLTLQFNPSARVSAKELLAKPMFNLDKSYLDSSKTSRKISSNHKSLKSLQIFATSRKSDILHDIRPDIVMNRKVSIITKYKSTGQSLRLNTGRMTQSQKSNKLIPFD